MSHKETAVLAWKQCENWNEGSNHGGGVGITGITSAQDNNIFPDIARDEWLEPSDYYRKIFLTATSGEITHPLIWIEADTLSDNDSISIRLTGTLAKNGDPYEQGTGEVILEHTLIGGIATCTAVIGDGTAFLSEFNIGERAYYRNDHTLTLTVCDITEIVSDTHMHITPVTRDISGDEGIEWGTIWLDNLLIPELETPLTVETALQSRSLTPGNPIGIFIQRHFIGGARTGYKGNSFTIRVETGD